MLIRGTMPGFTQVKLTIAIFILQSALGYENAYDLLERRNNRYYEPRSFHYHSDNTRYYQNRNPYYSSINQYTSRFGNGYDNLGNGIPIGHFRSFRQDWKFQPVRDRSFGFEYRDVQPRSNYHGSRGFYYNSRPSNGLYENEYNSRGNNDYLKVDRIFVDNEDKRQRKNDGYHQRNQEGVLLDTLRNEKAGERLHSDQIGENKSSLRSNKVLKRGKTTKGFAVHHHKDETGNSTTFFDETSDFGGQSDLRDIADGFNTRKSLEQITHRGDEKYFRKNEGQTADYGNGVSIENQKFEKDITSMGGHQESAGQLESRNEDNFGRRKTYQYLNGDRFEFSDPQVDDFY